MNTKEINENNVHEFLNGIGFVLKDGELNTYHKIYTPHKNFEIFIKIESNFFSSKINYGRIKRDRDTTCDFSKQENFVILECINRLLEKGYSPDKIILEKYFRTGRKGSGGFLDIQVLDKHDKSFLMIECKTIGKEYEKEKKEIRQDGGQLFSYFTKNDTTKYLCLYSSYLSKKIHFENEIIIINEEIFKNNEKTFYENWDKKILSKGLFDDVAKPYLIDFESVKKLNEITENISNKLYNKFAEILRKNSISDKTNAYNKIFNLLLCKIVDEDNFKNKGRRFEFKPSDDYISFLGRLNDLYKEGVEDYLRLEVTDYSEETIEEQLKLYLGSKDYTALKKMYNEIRLYKNNEFSFIDVYNKETFEKNALIVKEIVELFQNLKFRYNRKQQFLGDFFEELLNTGIKQEEGQFFTPTPITSFVAKSLPIFEIINKKNDLQEKDFLPFVIDYACGSGHFLTEVMEEIQKYINSIEPSFIKGGKNAENEFFKLKGNYNWAEKYVYGIDQDYRLTKTAKISTLLNGDGLANVFCDDGLNKFSKYKEKYGILHRIEDGTKENRVFDILVTNPPYSVKEFKDNIENFGEEAFELYPFIEEGKIECFFVERAKQLLKDGGVCGIVLPVTILSNTGLYTKTRELILQYFNIKGIVNLGGDKKVFMKTGTHTVILFLERIQNNAHLFIRNLLEESFERKEDLSINKIKKPIEEYLKTNHDLTFKDFKTLLNFEPNETIKCWDLFKEYKKEFSDLKDIKKLKNTAEFTKKSKENQEDILSEKLCRHILEREKEKIYYFILTCNQKTVLANLPEDGKEKERFLGYKFSGRRRAEGIRLHKDEAHNLITSLFDETNLENNKKVNYYILQNFRNNIPEEIHPSLAENLLVQNLSTLMNFKNVGFEKKINLNPEVEFETSLNKIRLGNKYSVTKGQAITEKSVVDGKIPVIAGGKEPAYFHNVSNRKGDIITVSASGANAGYVNYFKDEIFASDCSTIEKMDEKYSIKYLYYLLKLNQEKIYYLQRGNSQPHVYPEDLENLRIPALENQSEFIREIELIESQQRDLSEKIEKENQKITDLLKSAGGESAKIKNILVDIRGKVEKVKEEDVEKEGAFPVVSQSKEEIIGYTSLANPIDKSNLPLIVFGDHNKEVKYIDYEFVVGADGVKLLKPNESINEKIFYYLIKNLKIRSNQKYQRHFSLLEEETITLPPKPKQPAILKKIEEIESKIGSDKNKIKNLEGEKKKVLKKYLD